MLLDANTQLKMYREMLLIRRFEEKVHQLFRNGIICGTAHTYIGQEAVAVGVCNALRPDDYIVSTHRGHGHCLAKGGDPRLVMAQLLGKSNGYCRGKGGSMHIANRTQGNLGALGIVGAGIPIATGAALSAKKQHTGQVSVAFFGDGAANEGVFHESCNLASIWNLPVVYVCENNNWALSVPFEYHSSVSDIAVRAQGYNFPGVVVDGNDVLGVYDAARAAVDRARKGLGPSLIECKTRRQVPHSAFWGGRDWRPEEEVEDAIRQDPIQKLRLVLLQQKMLSESDCVVIEESVKHDVDEATEFAISSSQPDIEVAFDDIYA